MVGLFLPVRDVVVPIVADHRLGLEVKTTIERFDKIADYLTIDRYFDLVAFVARLFVDDGTWPSTFAVDVLGNVTSISMPSVTQLAIFFPYSVGIFALTTVFSMSGKFAHD